MDNVGRSLWQSQRGRKRESLDKYTVVRDIEQNLSATFANISIRDLQRNISVDRLSSVREQCNAAFHGVGDD